MSPSLPALIRSLPSAPRATPYPGITMRVLPRACAWLNLLYYRYVSIVIIAAITTPFLWHRTTPILHAATPFPGISLTHPLTMCPQPAYFMDQGLTLHPLVQHSSCESLPHFVAPLVTLRPRAESSPMPAHLQYPEFSAPSAAFRSLPIETSRCDAPPPHTLLVPITRLRSPTTSPTMAVHLSSPL